jgi:hypothetical protein
VAQDVAWGGVLLSHGGSWARSLPKADLWPLVVLPPIVGEFRHCQQVTIGNAASLQSKPQA